MDGPWHQAVVARLCELKIRGWAFDGAWTQALSECPPRGRDAGTPRLFDEDGHREVSHVEAVRGYCDDAWHGRKPGLAKFTFGLTVDLDLSGWEPEDVAA